MANVNEYSMWGIASDLLNMIGGGKITDDRRISERQIMWWFRQWFPRVYAEEQLNTRPKPMDMSMVRSFCIQLKKSDPSECGCGAGCKVWKGTIPKFMQWYGQSTLTYAGATDGTVQYTRIDNPGLVKGMQTGRFRANTTYYYVSGTTIFVFPPPDMLNCNLLVKGIPEDIAATSNGCFDYWGALNIPLAYISRCKQKIAQFELGIEVQAVRDDNNNNNPA